MSSKTHYGGLKRQLDLSVDMSHIHRRRESGGEFEASLDGPVVNYLPIHHKFHSVEICVAHQIRHKYDGLTLMHCQLCPIHIIMDIPGHCSCTLENLNANEQN